MALFRARNGTKNFWLTYTIYLEWEDVSAYVQVVRLNVFEKLFNEKLLADCTIVASNGAGKNCHVCVLAAHSDVFHTMLTVGLTKSQTRRIEYDDVGDEALDNVLAYCYGQELSMERLLKEVAIEIFQTAHKYNIPPLECIMQQLLIRKSDDWFTMNNVFTLYFFSGNVDSFQNLTEKMLMIMKR